MTILVVDDEPQLRTLLADLLQEEKGWKVHTAADGQAALGVLAKETVDIVVTDIYMPVMNGLRMRDAIRQDPKLKDLPILFISGYDDQMTMAAVRSPKIESFLRKGRSPGDIKAWIRYLTTPVEKRIGLSPGDRSMSR